ncbi:Dolichol phosphate-mannose biosynthesis regulatory [Penicillium chermesinum]|uniref:Dolichol phosphate-mannose biosynthesis regulatory protein n=1 Tax=Penicillium chermesinum TaxID=63820 RepID=A0A9W9PFM3_9EURO|nr:Dolichol phosphate-mannose biosynthesis regulatory [Penicillium chermesinum]KAJ5245850.1 Dolichol phosphate-mannose biosynthesis regulatory [Penicillium chermesinum]KAJ6144148.1 Dolichol phosphate-mannose biosynthesis regulatory [Penicillium chermesinum]
MLGQLVGSAMLLAATAIFLYYTAWTLLMVGLTYYLEIFNDPDQMMNYCVLTSTSVQPFVVPGHPIHALFPPRVWAIRIPVILTLLGSAVVGTFIGIVMINSNKKKAAKAKAAAKKKT